MTTLNSGPRGPKVSWMAWNKPGGSSNGGNRRGGGGLGGLFDKLPSFGGGLGDGSPLRWIWIVLGLWLAFSCFVLIGEQYRGLCASLAVAGRTGFLYININHRPDTLTGNLHQSEFTQR